jgi:hypothetical protein
MWDQRTRDVRAWPVPPVNRCGWVVVLILALPLCAQRVSVLSVMPVSPDARWGRLSSDGTKLLYVEKNFRVRIVDLKTRKTLDLASFHQALWPPQFGPGDTSVYLMAQEAGDSQGLFIVSIPEGRKKKILSNLMWFNLPADGRQLLFRSYDGSTKIADSEGGQERTLVTSDIQHFSLSSASWDPSGLVRVQERIDAHKWKSWTIDPRTGERSAPTTIADAARRFAHDPFGIEKTGDSNGNPSTPETMEISWGRICRYSKAGKVLERLTPETDRYVQVLKIGDDATLLAFQIRPPEFWDGFKDALFQYQTVTPSQFELVTLKVLP